MNTTTLSKALDDYDVRRLRARSKGTQENAHSQLRRMEVWVAKEIQPDPYLVNIDDTAMTRYFNTLRPPRLEAASFNHYRTIMNSFWVFCLQRGWIERNPMEWVERLPIPEKARTQLAPEEMLMMLEEADKPRDRIALAVGMNTGLRAGDIAALKIGAVNLHDNTLSAYIQKTKRFSLIGITTELRSELLKWFYVYAEMMELESFRDLNDEWTLVPSMRSYVTREPGVRIDVLLPQSTFTNLHEIVKTAMEKRGFPLRDKNGKSLREGFHTLRRSAGRQIHDDAAQRDDVKGSAMRAAQAFLGHKTQQVTELYLGLDHDKKVLDGMMRGQSFLTRIADRNREANAALDDAEPAEPLKRVRHA